uniref:Uncharacterized protein n=1 Tax=Solanum tuberosum TaxID=4113 RepID=M0ZR57_SOLTU
MTFPKIDRNRETYKANITCCGAANRVLRSQVYTRTEMSLNTLKTRIPTEIERE